MKTKAPLRVHPQFIEEIERINRNINEMYINMGIKKRMSKVETTKFVASIMPSIEINSITRGKRKKCVEVKTFFKI